MPYLTVLGWSLIPMPAGPAFSNISYEINDAVGQVISPYTGQSQVQIWPGADLWTVHCELPSMTLEDASNWTSWLMAMRGKANVTQFQDPLRVHPRGSQSGSPVVDGIHLASATVLNTRGWTANAQGVMKNGDQITLGWRLHQIIGDVNADAAGKASIEIWPSLREAISDGVTVITQGTTGLFRLADNKRRYDVAVNQTYGISFDLVEAR